VTRYLDIHQVRLDISEIEFDRLWLFLAEDERSRADRFKREYLRRNFVAARGNLRALLAQRLGCLAQEIQFSYGDRGKPYIRDSDIYFNLAHSQNLAIYAICSDREVGIDLEYINPECDFEGIARRYFLRSEQQIIEKLQNQNSDLARRAFYRAWTLKEAYGKATGQGIANILDLVDVSQLLEISGDKTLQIGDWTIKLLANELDSELPSELDIDVNYVSALCIAS
jgi:4'-phosphopantetheinyl transferase